MIDKETEAQMVKQGHTAQRWWHLGLNSEVQLQSPDTSSWLKLRPFVIRKQQWTYKLISWESDWFTFTHNGWGESPEGETQPGSTWVLTGLRPHKTLTKVTWLNYKGLCVRSIWRKNILIEEQLLAQSKQRDSLRIRTQHLHPQLSRRRDTGAGGRTY